MDDVILNKITSLERCIKRVEYEYRQAENFKTDYTRQDAAMLNLQRSCELAIDLANYLIRKKKLGSPTASRQSFDILYQSGIIAEGMAENLKKMVGFRNLAIHEYQSLNMEILESIIIKELGIFSDFGKAIIDLK